MENDYLEPRSMQPGQGTTADMPVKTSMTNLSDLEEAEVLEYFEKCYMEGKNFLGPHFTTCEANEKFAYGNQWDPDEERLRTQDPGGKRPCLTFNKVLRIGKRIVNDVKQAHFGIKYIPKNKDADPLIAALYNVWVKKIESDNRCETIRQQGFEQGLFGGFGFWRVYTEWESSTSWNKKITTKRIINRRQVLFSKACIEPDLSDATWFVVHEVLPLATAKAKYPGIEFKDSYGGDFDSCWSDGENGAIISEQFCLKFKAATLVKFSPKTVASSAQIDEPTKAMWQAMGAETMPEKSVFYTELSDQEKILWDALPANFKSTYSRKSQKKTWMWYKFAGRKCIAAQEWEGDIAPIVFCRGREYWIEGKRHWMAITTMLRDPQTLYNYYRSTQSERLTMAADAPWLLTAEHIAGYEDVWKTAHTRPLRFLLYNLKHNNEDLPTPQRTQPIMGDPGLDNEVARLDREMLDIAGINLATLGEPSGERTGKAILVRQRQGELINADYTEGYMEAMHREAEIYLDLIPKTIPWEQAIDLLGEEDVQLLEDLKQKGIVGWGNGKYSVEIEIGSVSTTAREDEKSFWQEMIQSNPQIAPLVMDVLVETLGNKKSKLLSKRFKAMMPPEVQGITETSDGKQEDPKVAAVKQQAQEHVNQMGQQMQQLQEGLKKATEENQQLKTDNTMKLRELQLKEEELTIKKMDIDIRKDEQKLKYAHEDKKLGLEAQKAHHEQSTARSERSENQPSNVQA